jgi:hypothetical protein
MYEFILGFAAGAVTNHFVNLKKKKNAQIQVDADPFSLPSAPILIPKKKRIFIPGELANFWDRTPC